MDAWNKGTHGRSGLIERVRASPVAEADVEAAALAFLREHVPAKASPMCGNSICQDRRFLARWMPALEDYFHYRNLDVSTLKELARRWKPDLMKGVPKEGKHEALADVYESIEELRYYRDEVHAALSASARSALAREHHAVADRQEARVDARIGGDLRRSACAARACSRRSRRDRRRLPPHSMLSIAISPPARRSSRQAS